MKMNRFQRIVWTVVAVMVIASMLVFTAGPALRF